MSNEDLQLLGSMLGTIIALAWFGIPAMLASRRGRNPIIWFALGLINWLLAIIMLLVLRPLNDGDKT